LVDGVVGGGSGRAKGEKVLFGELLRMATFGEDEQSSEGASVVVSGLAVAVTGAETLDDVREVG